MSTRLDSLAAVAAHQGEQGDVVQVFEDPPRVLVVDVGSVVEVGALALPLADASSLLDCGESSVGVLVVVAGGEGR